MIILDTHIWIWWVHGDPKLEQSFVNLIQANEVSGIGISAISCWEVAKLVERGRLTLPVPVDEWINTALAYPGIRLIDLSPRIAVESTQLPGDFRRDPADQIIVATSRVLNAPLATVDTLISAYPFVKLAVERQ